MDVILDVEINFPHLGEKEGQEDQKELRGGTFSLSWKNRLQRRVLIGKQVNILEGQKGSWAAASLTIKWGWELEMCWFRMHDISFHLNGGPRKQMIFPGGSDGKETAYSAGDEDFIPGLGRCPGEGNGNLLKYSCLENSTDRGAWLQTMEWQGQT